MSIDEEIWSILRDGRLVELRPYVASGSKIRSMYLERDLYSQIFEEKGPEAEVQRFAQLQADLDVFLTSSTLDPNYLKGLTPIRDGVWEIRSLRPRPSIRVFGLFAGKDKFIATHLRERKDLGAWNSSEWREEIRRARWIWRQLFPVYDPKNLNDINDLITGAIDEKYFR